MLVTLHMFTSPSSHTSHVSHNSNDYDALLNIKSLLYELPIPHTLQSIMVHSHACYTSHVQHTPYTVKNSPDSYPNYFRLPQTICQYSDLNGQMEIQYISDMYPKKNGFVIESKPAQE